VRCECEVGGSQFWLTVSSFFKIDSIIEFQGSWEVEQRRHVETCRHSSQTGETAHKPRGQAYCIVKSRLCVYLSRYFRGVQPFNQPLQQPWTTSIMSTTPGQLISDMLDFKALYYRFFVCQVQSLRLVRLRFLRLI